MPLPRPRGRGGGGECRTGYWVKGSASPSGGSTSFEAEASPCSCGLDETPAGVAHSCGRHPSHLAHNGKILK